MNRSLASYSKAPLSSYLLIYRIIFGLAQASFRQRYCTPPIKNLITPKNRMKASQLASPLQSRV